jgi:hypothetical protein
MDISPLKRLPSFHCVRKACKKTLKQLLRHLLSDIAETSQFLFDNFFLFSGKLVSALNLRTKKSRLETGLTSHVHCSEELGKETADLLGSRRGHKPA